MAIAKSQTENVYKYLARAKTFTASFEKIQLNLCLFTNTVQTSARIVCVLAFFCSSKNVFHQFWMGVKCFLGVCLNDHVLRFYFFRQGNWLDCYFFSSYVILLAYEYMYCNLMTGKKIMERIKMQNVEMLKPWSIIKWDAGGIHIVLTQRSWAMIYGFSYNYYCCRFFFSPIFSAAFLFLSSHLRFFLWTRFGGSLYIVFQSENKAC